MDTPPIRQQVLATLSDGSAIPAEWDGAQWWQDLDNNPAQRLVTEVVVSWNWE